MTSDWRWSSEIVSLRIKHVPGGSHDENKIEV